MPASVGICLYTTPVHTAHEIPPETNRQSCFHFLKTRKQKFFIFLFLEIILMFQNNSGPVDTFPLKLFVSLIQIVREFFHPLCRVLQLLSPPLFFHTLHNRLQAYANLISRVLLLLKNSRTLSYSFQAPAPM